MFKKKLLAILFVALALGLSGQTLEARSIRVDTDGGNWGPPLTSIANLNSSTGVPSGLSVGFGTAPPQTFQQLFQQSGTSLLMWADNVQLDFDGTHYDAQTYWNFLYWTAVCEGNNAPSQCNDGYPPDCTNNADLVPVAIDYFVCNQSNQTVSGFNVEWGAVDNSSSPAAINSVTSQVIFYNLCSGGTCPVSSPPAAGGGGITSTSNSGNGGIDADIYTSMQGNNGLSSPVGAASGAWELEFNCPSSGCAGTANAIGASLLWNTGAGQAPTLYTITVAQLNAPYSNSLQPSGGPTQGLNEFVYNNGQLYAPPGWTQVSVVAPTVPTATAAAGSVALTWTATTGANSYNLYRSSVAGGEGSAPVQTGLTSPSASVSGLVNGNTYYFTVTAVYHGVESAQSGEASAVVLAAAPTNLQASAGAGSISLNWSASSGASNYSIYQGTAAGSESSTAIGQSSSLTYTVNGLTAGQTYYFVVKANDAGGASQASAETSGTVLAAVPTGVTATAGDTTVSVSWTGSTGASSYVIYEGTAAGGESATPAVTGVSGTSAIVSGLADNTTYYFKVAAVDAGGTSAQSAEVSATPKAIATPTPPAPAAPAKSGGGDISLLELLLGSALLVPLVRRRLG